MIGKSCPKIDVPEHKVLGKQILSLIQVCKSHAYQNLTYLSNINWKDYLFRNDENYFKLKKLTDEYLCLTYKLSAINKHMEL